MGRHDSSSSGSDSDRDDSRERKRARKDAKKTSSSSSSSSASKSHKHSRDSKSSKKDRKKDSKKKKSSSKSDRKHSKSHKSDRKRKRSRSASSTDRSDSESGSSRSVSPAKRSSASSSSAAAAAASSSKASVPSVLPPSESSVTRCLDLIETLLQHGGGDRSESTQQLQFMLFKLDSGSCVDTTAISDELVKHILNTMLRECGCKVRRDPETNEQGWMTPVNAKGRPAYKLLDVLAQAFKPKKETATATAPIGPTMPSAAASIGPALPPAAAASSSVAASSSDATATPVPRVLGPAMPGAEDFERLASGRDAFAETTAQEDEEEDDTGNFGPKMPSQMTPQELAAYDRLRASREHLAAVKHMEAASGAKRGGGREEWMTALPSTAGSGLPSAAAMVQLAASGDREALRGRGFSSKGIQKVEQDDDWTLGPAEKARRDAEKIAMRQAEQAVYNSARAITGDITGGSGGTRESANSSAAAAQAANDRLMARYKKQQAAAADSLMAAHAREAEAAAKAAKPTDGLFRWDHDKEMGMRAVKGTVALKKEMQSAFALSDNFAPASS